MSLSSLQAQLAALNGRNKHAGSTFGSSRRQEDAAGRGLEFSVEHGHHRNRGTNSKHKASILPSHHSAAAASDTPMHVIQEQFVAAWQILTDQFPVDEKEDEEQLHQLLQSSEGSASLDTPTVEKVLARICSWLGESTSSSANSSNIEDNCLLVLEYMIRRYDLHRTHMEELLWTLLPYYEDNNNGTAQSSMLSAVFHRALELVDLASHPSYLWLRPYVGKRQLFPRQQLAQKVMQNTNFVRTVCRLATRMAKLHCQEQAHRSDDADDDYHSQQQQRQQALPRRGIARVLSFTAAVLVEGLSWQATTTNLSVGNNEKQEAILRILLPYILQSVSNNISDAYGCSDWTTWGYCLASVLAETMDLAPVTVEALTTAMIKGVPSHGDADDDDGDILLLDARADALTAVLAVVLPPEKLEVSLVDISTTTTTKSNCFLPVIMNKGDDNDKNEREQQLLGCNLPDATVQALCKSWGFADTAAVLGVMHQERRILITPILATLLVRSVLTGQAELAVNLLENDLLADIFHDIDDNNEHVVLVDIVASLTEWILQAASSSPLCSEIQLSSSAVLKTLYRCNGLACERGIARAIQQQGGEEKELLLENENNDGSKKKQRMGKLLRAMRTSGKSTILMTQDDMDVDQEDDENNNNSSSSIGHELPPRLALEYADAAVRRHAVTRLVEEWSTAVTKDPDDSSDNAFSTDNDQQTLIESFWQPLLFRWRNDEDETVALGAAEALLSGLQEQENKYGADDVRESFWLLKNMEDENEDDKSGMLLNAVLAGVQRWVNTFEKGEDPSPSSGKRKEKDILKLLETSLSLVVIVARDVRRSCLTGPSSLAQGWLQKFLEVLVVQLDETGTLSSQAANAVIQILSDDGISKKKKKSKGTDEKQTALELVLNEKVFLEGLIKDRDVRSLPNNTITPTNMMVANTQNQEALGFGCLRVVLAAICSAFSQQNVAAEGKKKTKKAKSNIDKTEQLRLSDYAVEACLLLISSSYFQSDRCCIPIYLEKSLKQTFLLSFLSSANSNNENAYILVADTLSTLACINENNDVLPAMRGVLRAAAAIPERKQKEHKQKDDKLNEERSWCVFAVVMDVAVRLCEAAKGVAVERLLLLAQEQIANGTKEKGMKCNGIWLGILPCLALLDHQEQRVRKACLKLLRKIGNALTGEPDDSWCCLKQLCLEITSDENKSSANMGGGAFLSQFLCQFCRANDRTKPVSPSKPRQASRRRKRELPSNDPKESSRAAVLLKLSVLQIASISSLFGNVTDSDMISFNDPNGYYESLVAPLRTLMDDSTPNNSESANSINSWLNLYQSLGLSGGSIRAVTAVLKAMEQAAQDPFPLTLRWKLVGQPFLRAAILTSSRLNENPANSVNEFSVSTPATTTAFLETLVAILKGAAVVQAPSEPTTNTRREKIRSSSPHYTASATASTLFLEPYPSEMAHTIIEIVTKFCCEQESKLGLPRSDALSSLAHLIAKNLFFDPRWGEGVFMKQSHQQEIRKRLASVIFDLTIVSERNQDSEMSLIANFSRSALPFDSTDAAELIELEGSKRKTGNSESFLRYLDSISILMDFIRANSLKLLVRGDSRSANFRLVSLLFDFLPEFISEANATKIAADTDEDEGTEDTDTNFAHATEFACQSVLLTLENMLVKNDDESDKDISSRAAAVAQLFELFKSSSSKTLERWVSILLQLLMSESSTSELSDRTRKGNGENAPMLAQCGSQLNLSFSAKSAILSLLSLLCAYFSGDSVSLITSVVLPALSKTISQSIAAGLLLHQDDELFTSMVSLFARYADDEFSLAHLFSIVVTSTRQLSQAKRARVYESLIHSLYLLDISEMSNKNEDKMMPDLSSSRLVGALVASILADDVFLLKTSSNFIISEHAIEFSVQILHCAPTVAGRVASLTLLLQYTNQYLTRLRLPLQEHTDQLTMDGSFGNVSLNLPTHSDIERMATHGSEVHKTDFSQSAQQKVTRTLAQGLLRICNNAVLQSTSIRKFISYNASRDGGSNAAALSLRLWQDLLLVKHTASGWKRSLKPSNARDGDHSVEDAEDPDETSFWESSSALISESLEYLQGLLPTHIFLASVTSLMQAGGETTSEIQATALQLLADRVQGIDGAQSPEASLYVEDAMPILVDILKLESSKSRKTVPEKGSDYTQMVLKQSALIAVEHIARAFALSSTTAVNDTKHGIFLKSFDTEPFLTALARSVELFQDCKQGITESKFTNDDVASSSRQLICSVALCSATLVRVLRARALPFLPRLISLLVDTLTSANSEVASLLSCNSYVAEIDEKLAILPNQQARVMQLSVIRAITAIAETVPQFLSSHLHALLSGSTLLSSALRKLGDVNSNSGKSNVASVQLAAAIERLDQILSTRVTSRLFLPAASKAMVSSSQSSTEMIALLSMIKSSVEISSTAEATAQKYAVFKSVTTAYEYDGRFTETTLLVDAANETLLALVLKLSEVQLRRLYSSFRTWSNDIERKEEHPSRKSPLSSRRYAFWSMSTVLSKQLRSIFLPCLSIVFDDVVAELELAVSAICGKKQKRFAQNSSDRKKKRQRLGDSDCSAATITQEESTRPLLPLLVCLEQSFRADAHDGGSWIRSQDRYNMVLEPLSKLLQCRIVPGCSVSDDNGGEDPVTFQTVVLGSLTKDGVGSVVGCLTALAAAAGNEQLWKPLNHSVLDACGNESRPEVRKAGLVCLHSLMKTLGEEYMVLLPECLPTLSELLEDVDEEIAGLAKECVSLGEDLIGESLEESLR